MSHNFLLPENDSKRADSRRAADSPSDIDRRTFLEAAGFAVTAAALGGCRRAPEQTALPRPSDEHGQPPGSKQIYAATCGGCSAGCGLLVTCRDGRPLKMEGMPSHRVSHGGLCPVGQALPLELYDSHRLPGPLHQGKPAAWVDIDAQIVHRLRRLREEERPVRMITPTVTSPTLQHVIDQFLSAFPDARHVTLDSVSHSAVLDSHHRTHQIRVVPHYQLEKASAIVSFGADFLGTWISPVEFTRAWSRRRDPGDPSQDMSYHVQVESRMSLTGSNADRRYAIHPDEQPVLIAHLAQRLTDLRLAERKDSDSVPELPEHGLASGQEASAEHDSIIRHLAKHLWNRRGASLVLCDSQDVDVQVLVNYINHVLGNYGKTLHLDRPSRQHQMSDTAIDGLLDELQRGEVGGLLVAGVDLAHVLPDWNQLHKGLDEVPLVISFAHRRDELAERADFVCPDHHPLESWFDAQPIHGLISVSQPVIHPLHDTRSLIESLSRWSGRDESAYDILRAYWEEHIYPRRKMPNTHSESGAIGDPAESRVSATSAEGRGRDQLFAAGADAFTRYWQQALHDGFVEIDVPDEPMQPFQLDSVKPLPPAPPVKSLALVLYTKVGMPSSRHAHNPWLHELPDPVTKVTWGNYACVSQASARRWGLVSGDVVQVEMPEGTAAPIELPVWVQPGQHDQVVAVALGYGCKGTDRFARVGPQWLEARPTVAAGGGVGVNAAALIHRTQGRLAYTHGGIVLKKTGRRQPLASTQEHHALKLPSHIAPRGAEERDVVQQTTLTAFRGDPHAGAAHHHEDHGELWPDDHPKRGASWAMAIDLNACTGCSACVIACQSENNIPVVGRDEVRRQREMHWIRIDRYYVQDADGTTAVHQPMMCQHCDHAPCETVCPVLATVHSEDGLNEQVYNRCVGTRYCANNCPYKVRRFNWFKYAHDDTLQNLALNPEVTVRTRGVMEKCSMCVQRIDEMQLAARSRGEPVADGEIQTACQQSCPASAIVFGDRNDPTSRIAALVKDPRRYRVLEELNVRPSVSYLRVVRNRDEESERG